MSLPRYGIAALVSLRVTGVSPEEVTARLGRKPKKVLPKATESANCGGRDFLQEQDSWVLERAVERKGEVTEVFVALVKSLTFRRAEFHAIRDKADSVTISIALFLDDGTGGLEIGPDALAEVADLGLAVRVDIYCLPDPD